MFKLTKIKMANNKVISTIVSKSVSCSIYVKCIIVISCINANITTINNS